MSHFTENRYHLHLIVGFGLGFLFSFFDLKDTGLFFQLFLPTFLTFISACVWEWLWEFKNNAPFDWMDIFWSAIGGLIGSLIFLCF